MKTVDVTAANTTATGAGVQGGLSGLRVERSNETSYCSDGLADWLFRRRLRCSFWKESE